MIATWCGVLVFLWQSQGSSIDMMAQAFSAMKKISAEFTIPEVMRVGQGCCHLTRLTRLDLGIVTGVVAIFAAFYLEAQDINKHDCHSKVCTTCL